VTPSLSWCTHKNALDWLHLLGRSDPPYLYDKVIGPVSAVGGTKGLQAISTMEFSSACACDGRDRSQATLWVRGASAK
jgi:hypothetical protein